MGSVRDPGETAWKKSANPHPSPAAGVWRQPGTEGSTGKPPRCWQVPLRAQPAEKPPAPGHQLALPGALGSAESSRGRRRAGAITPAPKLVFTEL